MAADPSICVQYTRYKVLFSLFSLGLLTDPAVVSADYICSTLLMIQSYFIHASLFYV